MSVQQFCLRWNNHQPNFVSVLKSLLNSESLVDVTLAAEGRHLQAHKVVLSACSSYFQTLFTINPCQHPIVILKDVKYNDLKTMVDFMYFGEVNVSQEQLPAVLKTAEMLKVKGLADMPEQNLGSTMHMSKSLSVSSDKAELFASGEMNWSSSEIRRSASPLSLSMRRKRFRKSSTGSGSGSTERTSEDVPSEVMLIPSPAVVKPEPNMSSGEGDGRHLGSLRNNTQEPSTDSEPREGSQDSVEDDPDPLAMMSQDSNVEGSIADPGTVAVPSTSMAHQPLSTQGLPWTFLEHGYPRLAGLHCSAETPSSRDISQFPGHQMVPLPSCAVGSAPPSPCLAARSTLCSSPCNGPVATTQVRRKRSTNPQADENFIRALEAVRFGGIGFCKAARMYGVNNRTLWLEYKKRGYPVTRPSLKNRVKPEQTPVQMEPSASLVPPQVMGPPLNTAGMNEAFVDPRSPQFAHPHSPMPPRHRFQESLQINATPSSMNIHSVHFSTIKLGKRGRLLIRQPRVKRETDGTQPSPESEPGSPQLLPVPSVRIERQYSEPQPQPSGSQGLLAVPQQTFLVKQLSLPSQSAGLAVQPSQPHVQLLTVAQEQLPSPAVLNITPEQEAQLRVRRTTSSPQASPSPRDSHEPQRSGHCPVLRLGPALGCNFCWNTIDGHGRILRRKTKYHCPECQTNLCIVPCFQEYHERLSAPQGNKHSSVGSVSPTNVKLFLPKTSSV